MLERVLGVDACPGGWIGIVLTGDRVDAHVSADIAALVEAAEGRGPVQVVAVDMPIGLPDTGVREADRLARKQVGGRSSSVFTTPVRRALEEQTHAAASARNIELDGPGISVQSFGLKAKLMQLDAWVRATDRRVVEVHPEVSFKHLAGAPLDTRKNTWAGAQQRRDLLAGEHIVLPADLGLAGTLAGVDDVLDAAVAAWTARRVLRGLSVSYPPDPQRFSDGLPAAIHA